MNHHRLIINKRIQKVFFLFTLLSVSFLYAEEDTTSNRQYPNLFTEADAIEMAVNHNRKIKSLETNLQITEYQLKYGNWIKNPELRVRDISTHYFTEKFEEYNIGLRWRFQELGEVSKRKQDVRVDYWNAKVRKMEYHHNLIARVRRNFADVRMNDRLTKLAKKKVELETKRIAIIKNMVDLGERSVVYYTKAKMWHAESGNHLSRMKQRKRLARLKLSKLTGITENDSLIFTSIPEINDTFEEIIELALDNRPEINLINQKIKSASKQYQYERLQLVPWFTFIEGSYHKEKKSSNDWTEIRLGMTIPIFNPNIANIKSTHLAVEKKESELETIREQIEEEVRDTYTTYMDLMLDWKNFTTNAKQLIEEANAIINKAHLHQTLLPDEVLEMELTIIETQSILEEKRNRLMRAYLDLEKIVGVENLAESRNKESH